MLDIIRKSAETVSDNCNSLFLEICVIGNNLWMILTRLAVRGDTELAAGIARILQVL